MKIKKGDVVKVISGSYSGKEGRVLKVMMETLESIYLLLKIVLIMKIQKKEL